MSDNASGAPPAAFRMRPYWQVLALIALFALWPLVVVYLTSLVADLAGCTIGAGPCPIGGADAGPLLAALASVVQVSVMSLPVGLMLGFLWLCVLGFSWMAYRRKRSGVADYTRLEVNFGYYGLTLVALVAVAFATVQGWLPSAVLIIVIFAAIFWAFSFVFALLSTLRDRAKSR